MVTVAMSGLHGAGKTTAAKKLSEKLGLRYVSAGQVFRKMAEEKDMSLAEFSEHVEEHPEIDKELDARTAEEAKKDDVLIDARLAGWMAEDADIKILLIAPLEERIRRIAQRDDSSYEEVKRETLARGESEEKRYMDLYDIDVEDHSVFDLIVSTERFDEEETLMILERAVEVVSEK